MTGTQQDARRGEDTPRAEDALPVSPLQRRLWRAFIWFSLFLAVMGVVGWMTFGYTSGDWTELLPTAALICLAMMHPRPRQSTAWIAAACVCMGVSAFGTLFGLID